MIDIHVGETGKDKTCKQYNNINYRQILRRYYVSDIIVISVGDANNDWL